MARKTGEDNLVLWAAAKSHRMNETHLQKPPRSHWPRSFWRQHASRKSVTGDSSAYSGRPGITRCHVSASAEETTRSAPSGRSRKVTRNGRRTGIPALVQLLDRALRLVLPVEPRVHVPNQVITDVVAHVHLEHVAVLDQLAVRVLVCAEFCIWSVSVHFCAMSRGSGRYVQNLSNCSCVSASLSGFSGVGMRGGASFGRKCGFEVEPWTCAGFCSPSRGSR